MNTVIDTPRDIERARKAAIFHALKLEVETGLRRSSRGPSTLKLFNSAFGKDFKNKRKAVEWYQEQEARQKRAAIIYQLDKVDQGGDVSDLVENRTYIVADAFDLQVVEDDDSPFFGAIDLGDGTYAQMYLVSEIVDSDGKVMPEEASQPEPGFHG